MGKRIARDKCRGRQGPQDPLGSRMGHGLLAWRYYSHVHRQLGHHTDGCSDTGKAVLRAAMKHPGVPDHSETSPAMMSDSPCSSTISTVKMSKRDCIFGAIRVASATATGQPYPIGHAHKVAHQRLWQQQGSGFWVWRACAAAWGARSRSNATGQEWIDLADRSIQSWRCEEMACNGHRGVNRGMGVGLWLSHVPRVRVRGHFTAL